MGLSNGLKGYGLIQYPYGVATGGTSSTITAGGVQYTLLTFTGSGTLTITKAGLFDFLVVGCGGGGYSTWGAGAGAVVEVIGYYLGTGTKSVVVAGGAPANNNGVSTYVDKITAPSGGYGDNSIAGTGASGGGGPYATGSTQRWIINMGNAGSTNAGGGAGGAASGSTGGVGLATSFSGTSVTYGTGGSSSGTAPSANTGSGGNGGQAGASGLVLVRFKI